MRQLDVRRYSANFEERVCESSWDVYCVRHSPSAAAAPHARKRFAKGGSRFKTRLHRRFHYCSMFRQEIKYWTSAPLPEGKRRRWFAPQEKKGSWLPPIAMRTGCAPCAINSRASDCVTLGWLSSMPRKHSRLEVSSSASWWT